jgi:uncharacterized protein YraI
LTVTTRIAIRLRSDRRQPVIWAWGRIIALPVAPDAGKERPAMSGISRATARPTRCANIVLLAAMLFSAAGAAIVVDPREALAASATTTSALNLRVGFRLTSKVKLVMPAGSRVDIVNRSQNGYWKVVYQGVRGYAHGDYLDVGGGSSSGGGGGGNVSTGGRTGSASVLSSLNLRAGPSTSDRVLAVMPTGATITLTGESSNGFLKATYNGTTGWAYADYVGTSGSAGDSPDADPGSGNAGSASTTSSLNLRSGPNTSSRVLLVMPSGASVTLTGESSGGFLGVTYRGTSGWASSTYLSTGGGSNNGGNSGGSDYDTNGDGAWSQNEIIAIIYAAAAYYGVSSDDMLRVARCESGLDPYNVTPPYSASGLFQFLPGTWATTPYASADIFDPVSSAFATGWMWANGRRGEWVCQ